MKIPLMESRFGGTIGNVPQIEVTGMSEKKLYNEILKFEYRKHEALMGVWWSGLLLKKHARKFFQEYLSSEVQFNIMILLKYAEHPLSQRELSERLLVDKSNLTGVCGRMEAAGLLTRSASPGDQRAYALELTPAGRDILEHVEGPYRERIRSFMQGCDDQEIARFTEYQTRLQRELIRQEEERP